MGRVDTANGSESLRESQDTREAEYHLRMKYRMKLLAMMERDVGY